MIHGVETAFVVFIVLLSLSAIGVGVRGLLMWMGERGWIFYGNNRGSIGAGALAAMEIASMLEPEVAHVVEEVRSEERRGSQDESGEGDDPDGGLI
jgi:hypothetical protein